MGFSESESWRLKAHFETPIHWSAALAPLTHWWAKNATSSDHLPSPIYVYELFFSLVFHFVFAPYCKKRPGSPPRSLLLFCSEGGCTNFPICIAASVKSPVKFFLIRFKEGNFAEAGNVMCCFTLLMFLKKKNWHRLQCGGGRTEW